MTKDRSFKLVEPFKVGYRGGSLPMLIAENSLGFTAQIEIQECDLDVDQARALRDWLTSVLPDEPTALQTKYDEALRALQNTLLAVPDGDFKRQMDDWLSERLGLPLNRGG